MYDLLKTLAAQLLMPLPVVLVLLTMGLLLALLGRRRSGIEVATAGLAPLLLSSGAR